MKLRFPKMGIGIVSLAILFAATSGCGDAETARTVSDKPVVAVTIVPQKTFVEAVCGDLAEVVVLVPPGNSPENYEPTPETMEKFSEAAVYFTIGVPAETANILARAEEMQVVSLHEAAAAVYEERTFDEGERDPHVWLSPKRVKVMIDAIAEQMAALDPKNEAAYRQNAKAYQEQLDLLDGRIRDAFSGIKDRKFIVFHPAFGYLADDYGLMMYALEEEGKESTPQRLQEMIDFAKRERIRVVFYQEEMDSSQVEGFAEEIGAVTKMLSPLAADYMENLENMAKALAEAMQ